MTTKALRYIRQIIATAIFVLITGYFLDFSGTIPDLHLQDAQLIPSILRGAWILTAAILLSTLIFGRIYCSALCPLGILMDIIAKTSGRGAKKNFKDKNKRYPYTAPHNILRYTILGITAGTFLVTEAFIIVSALDPYSNFGRIAFDVFAPVYYSLNNALAWVCGELGLTGVYKMSFAAFSWVGSVVSLAILAVIGVMAYTKGRLWCNTICPAGALLSLLSRYSFLKIKIDQSKCTSCGLCTSACKSACIDTKNRSVDNSRCVVCFDCLGRCSRDGVSYSFSWPFSKKKSDSVASPQSEENKSSDISRREFLATTAAIALTATVAANAAPRRNRRVCALVDDCPTSRGCNFNRPCYVEGERLPVSPPGSLGIEEFNKACTSCHLCITRCPSQVLVPSVTQYGMIGFLQPVMRYDGGHFCAYDCNVCSQVCPTGAIKPLTVEQKHTVQVGIAHLFSSKCVAMVQDYDCGACAEHCPVGAVHMVINRDGVPIPEIIPEVCIGCGACEQICPERAILVYGHQSHRRAILPKKEEAREIELDDFGF